MEPCSRDQTFIATPYSSQNTAPPTIHDTAITERNTVNDTSEKQEDGITYPHGMKMVLIMGSSYMTMFLVALVSFFDTPCQLPHASINITPAF